MTKDDIIKLAKQCGHWSGETIEMNDVGIMDFANLVAAAEPICPDCKAALLYECIGCSSNNYPPKRPWVGLTEFEFAEIYNKWNDTNGSTPWGLNQALEAKLKELNK